MIHARAVEPCSMYQVNNSRVLRPACMFIKINIIPIDRNYYCMGFPTIIAISSNGQQLMELTHTTYTSTQHTSLHFTLLLINLFEIT